MATSARSGASFVTVDVFTHEPFTGNQLAVVNLTSDTLSQDQKFAIAREFNFSETVFLHLSPDRSPRLDIFTPMTEMQFAGHPVIGTGHVLLKQYLSANSQASGLADSSMVIVTKAGEIELNYDAANDSVSAAIPHDIHIHERQIPTAELFETQPRVVRTTSLHRIEGTHPIVSIVRGVTYVLANLTAAPECFSAITAGPAPAPELDADWQSNFIGTMYYRLLDEPREVNGHTFFRLRVRMITEGLEDPACGSGSCALAAYLALQSDRSNHRFHFSIEEGAEISRPSHITVEIETGKIASDVVIVRLAGSAVLITKGQIQLP